MKRVYKPTGSPSYSRSSRSKYVSSVRSAARSSAVGARRKYSPRAAIPGEMKYFDCDYTATAITALTTTWPGGTMVDPLTTINLGSAAVANPLCLVAPTVGAALNQRIGRQILVRKIKVRGTINVPAQAAAATADSATRVRIMLVHDMQTNATQMTGAQLMQDASAANTTVNSFQNPNNFGRFRVLKDKTFTLYNPNMAGSPTTADLVQQGLTKTFKWVINFKVPVAVHFNATNGGTVADIVDNSFHMVAGTDNTTLAPTLIYYSRVAYKE